MGRGVVAGRVAAAVVLVSVAGGRLAHAEEAGGVPDAGMRAYVDPRTGRLLSEPPAGRQVPPSDPASTSTEGLVETPLPHGGVMLDVRGRFQSPLVATVDADGRVHLGHAGEAH